MKTILILGATSAIAIATARLWAKDKSAFILLGRNATKLKAVKNDLIARGASTVEIRPIDCSQTDKLPENFQAIFDEQKEVDTFLMTHGILPDQTECNHKPKELLRQVEINGTSAVIALSIIAEHMEKQGHGNIIAVTSVAGDRGRQSNYAYGATKKLVSTFLEGLAHRFHSSPIQIMDIRPGFVDTPMTQHIDRKGFLWSAPEKIAQKIFTNTGKGSRVVYAPSYWFFIMMVIRLIPNHIFRRTKL